MIRKGKVTGILESGAKASVYFAEMDTVVDLPVMRISNAQRIQIGINDMVIVTFWGRNLLDGIVIGRVD